MKICFLLFIAAGVMLQNHVIAQSLPEEPFRLNESLIESVVSGNSESGDYEYLMNELEELQKKPLDLNKVKREDLDRLPFLTGFQISSLLAYRDAHGPFISIYELQVVYGFTEEVIVMMLPFVCVYPEEPKGTLDIREAARYGHHEFTLRTQRILKKPQGFTTYDSTAGSFRYPGSPWFVNVRYEFSSGDRLQAGITMEKDAGEELFKASNRNGFDFNSAFLLITNVGHVQSLVVGDYRLSFGQGLTLCSSTSPGKSELAMNIIKKQDDLKAFTANDENRYFRGIAASISLNNFECTGFVSVKKRDANITDTINGTINFSSFQESGYHRTASEIADENSVRETAFGANIHYRGNRFKLGTTVATYYFDKYLEAGTKLKDAYDFSGKQLVNWGTDYSVMLDKFAFFGEASYGGNHWACINGILFNANKYASFSLLYRNFQPGFYSLYSAAFSEGSNDTNEEGLYAGFVLHPVKRVKISGYSDFYRFPWCKDGISAPSSGNDFMLQTDYKPGKNWEMYLRIKNETNPMDETADSLILPLLSTMHHTGLRYQINYQLTKQLAMQNRIEMVRTSRPHSSTSEGVLIYHDVEYSLKKIPLAFYFRLAWFNTGDYDSRIYAYERDMTTGYSYSPLYDKGCRTYLMVTGKPWKALVCSLRFSSTWYFNRDTIGTGPDMIDSPSRNEIKFKASYRF
jgi:hypothetical protein